MSIEAPFIKELSSDARNRHNFATSSGLPSYNISNLVKCMLIQITNF